MDVKGLKKDKKVKKQKLMGVTGGGPVSGSGPVKNKPLKEPESPTEKITTSTTTETKPDTNTMYVIFVKVAIMVNVKVKNNER